MIANKCLTKEWVARKKQEMGSVDPALLEKSIHALALLCGLGESPIPFVFKGGTSIILLLREFRRLSIDIDIVTDMPRVKYEPVLDDIGGKAPFLGFEQDDRGERGLPHRMHFKFFYNSAICRQTILEYSAGMIHTLPGAIFSHCFGPLPGPGYNACAVQA